MKKWICLFVFILILIPAVSAGVFAADGFETTDEDGFVYVVREDGTAEITGYTGPGGDISIPGSVGGITVASIGENAFAGQSGLTSAVIPEGVTSIGNLAFSLCINLVSVSIPDSVTSIGDFAFSGCVSLTSADIPGSVASIGNYAFMQCGALTAVTVPAGASLGEGVFDPSTEVITAGPAEAEPADIPAAESGPSGYEGSITSLFSDLWTSLSGQNRQQEPAEAEEPEPADMPAEEEAPAGPEVPWTAVEQFVFEQTGGTACRVAKYTGNETEIIIPGIGPDGCTVTEIGKGAFSWNRKLVSVAIPEGVTFIGNQAFSQCGSLASVTIPGSVTAIGDLAFSQCTSLASVTIPEGVESIGDNAFTGCRSLASIQLPESVVSVGKNAFDSSTKLYFGDAPEGPDEESGPDVQPDEASQPVSFRVGDTLTFGRYEQDNNTANGPEDIEWQVLAVEDDRALVISRYALEAMAYNETFSPVTWETCTLRRWLNNDFYSNAFSDTEKTRIREVTNSNPDDPDYGTPGGNDTRDRIFLLSNDEGNRYLKPEFAECKATDYALEHVIANGKGIVNFRVVSWCWLRSPGIAANRAMGYEFYMDVAENPGSDVDAAPGSVRPAMWLDLNGFEKGSLIPDGSAAPAAPAQPTATAEPEAEEPEIKWTAPVKFVLSKGNTVRQDGRRIDPADFGIVLQANNQVGGWFMFEAPRDGDYVFSVRAPNLSGNSFRMRFYLDDKDEAAAATFKRSNEVQQFVLKGVKKGQSVYWWDDDNTGRGYTLLDSHELMITIAGEPAPSVQPAAEPQRSGASLPPSLSAGDIITFGSYEQDNIRANGSEPIEWQVLEVRGGRVLLISRYGLDSRPYNKTGKNVTWEESTLRRWLNADFYGMAFSRAERELIAEVSISNPDNPKTGTKGGNDTRDKIFLLSIGEAKRYFTKNDARKCQPTVRVRENGAYVSKNGSSSWWLRSPGAEQNRAAHVHYQGYVSEEGYFVEHTPDVVRPAFWLITDRSAEEKAGHDEPGNQVLPDSVRAGGFFTFGRYEQDNNMANGPEPIEWQLLAEEDDRALMISRYSLDAKPYNKINKPDVTWETCTLRHWLNGEFYNSAFSQEEKSRILKVTNENPGAAADNMEAPNRGAADENPTNDRVFLLNVNEIEQYIDEHGMEGFATEYAKANGAEEVDLGGKILSPMWWSRSRASDLGRNSAIAVAVSYLNYDFWGYNEDRSGYVPFIDDAKISVRPAFWLNLGEPVADTEETEEEEKEEDILYFISVSGDAGAVLRTDPSFAGTVIRVVLNGTQVEPTGERRTAEGREWIRIRVLPDGSEGWVPGDSVI